MKLHYQERRKVQKLEMTENIHVRGMKIVSVLGCFLSAHNNMLKRIQNRKDVPFKLPFFRTFSWVLLVVIVRKEGFNEFEYRNSEAANLRNRNKTTKVFIDCALLRIYTHLYSSRTLLKVIFYKKLALFFGYNPQTA